MADQSKSWERGKHGFADTDTGLKQEHGGKGAPSASQSAKPRKRPLLCLTAALLGVLLAAVGAEVAQRRLMGWPRYGKYLEYDRVLGTRMPRNAVQKSRDDRGLIDEDTNAEGFRSRPQPRGPKVPAAAGRLLVLGDSFLNTWGIRRAERFAEQGVQQSGLNVELDSIACDDWGPLQEWLALKTYGPLLEPDWVVLSLYVENDILNAHLGFAGMSNISASDSIRPYWNGKVDQQGWPEVTGIHPQRAWLRARSSLFARLEHSVVAGGRWSYFTTAAEAVRKHRELHFEFLTPEVDPHLWEPAWLNLERLVQGLANSVRRLGARPLVLIVPCYRQVQVCALTEERALARSPLAEHSTNAAPELTPDFDYPERRLMGFLKESGIDCAVALGALRKAATETIDGVYLRDGHLNAHGHIALGGVLAEWLTLVAGESEPPPEGIQLGQLGQGPIDLLPRGAAAPSCLDFQAGLHLPHIAYAINWRREPGWLGVPERMGEVIHGPLRAVLRADPGELVIHGHCAGKQGFPLAVRATVHGNQLGEMVLSAPGAFELRCPNPIPELLASVPPEKRPYIPLAFDFVPPQGAELPAIGVRWLGFCSRREAPRPQVAPDK
jgi:hypothetical protein